MNWSVITACNNEAVLNNCLRASPGVAAAQEVKVLRGFASSAKAYNAGIESATADVLVLAHQDVYFPVGWDLQLADAVRRLEEVDSQWGVLGVMGITRTGVPKGYLYCTGLQRVIGAPFSAPVECSTLDEVVLVVRRASGLRFDEKLPGFHLYGTDVCYAARANGFRSYVFSAFCVHNTSGLTFLPWTFWQGYFYLRRKWRRELPIRTPCITIRRLPLPLLEHPARSAYVRYVKGIKAGVRVADPAALYSQLRVQQALEPTA